MTALARWSGVLVLVAVVTAAAREAPPARGAGFTVDSTVDAVDANPR